MTVTQATIDIMYDMLAPLPPLLPSQTLTIDYGFGLVERVKPNSQATEKSKTILSTLPDDTPIGVAFGEYIY